MDQTTRQFPTFSPIHGSPAKLASPTALSPPPPKSSTKTKYHRHHSHRLPLYRRPHDALFAPDVTWLEHPGGTDGHAYSRAVERDPLAGTPGPGGKHRHHLRPHRRHRSHDGRLGHRSRKRDMLASEATSSQGPGDEGIVPGGTPEGEDSVRLPFIRFKARVSRADVEKQRENREMLEKSNAAALASVAERSISFSRRLDVAYYNLLDRLSSIGTMITSFQRLRDFTAAVDTDFTRDATKLVQDTNKHIADFDEFSPQIRRIEALESRMKNCQETALQLDKRLQVVREQIQVWDRKEIEWQNMVSRRLRILWAVMVCTLLLLTVVGLVDHLKPDLGLRRSNGGAENSLGRSVVVRDVPQVNNASTCRNETICGDMTKGQERPGRHLPVPDPEATCRSSKPSKVPTRETLYDDAEERIQRVLDEL
ncbi:hypothetical protein LOZ66_001330 [Ophidiomyces ophidiicola]|nr:hypothetical protein LOZ66_001330 [Ophidiomyces ophidiicola]